MKTVFSAGQLRKLKNRSKRIHWCAEDIANGIAIHSAGRKAYRLLLKKKYPLPSIPTLRKWCAKIQVRPGILQPVLDIVKNANMTQREKICVISFDEMKISKKFLYDKILDETIKPASYVQVMMIRGLIGNWKQPIFYDFDCAMTIDILSRAIGAVEGVGFRVVAMVCDLGGSNRGLLKQLNISVTKPWFVNPANPSKLVYVFADVPHLLKLIRNHFIDSGFIINGEEISKEIIEELLLKTKTSDLNITYKITKENLTVKNAQRQKVKLAAKLFSRTIAQAIIRGASLGELRSKNAVLCGQIFQQVIFSVFFKKEYFYFRKFKLKYLI